MTDPADLARLLAVIADDLDRRGYFAVGPIRQAAQALRAAPVQRPGDCPVCAGPVVQPTTGRRRTYCSAKCKKRAGRNGAERGASAA